MSNRAGAVVPQADRLSFLWLALAAVLMAFANGRWAFPIATWLMPVFAIRFLRTQRVVRGFAAIVVTEYVVGHVAWWGVYPVPLGEQLVMSAVMSVVGCLPLLADRLLAPRLPGLAATLVYPLALTAYEFVVLMASPLGTWSATAYTQYDCPALVQLASLTGLWGFPLLVGWVAAVANWAWERGFDWPRIRGGAVLCACVVLAALAYGTARLVFCTTRAGTVRVASLTALDLRADGADLARTRETDPEAFRRATAAIHGRHFAATTREARAGAKIICWAEAGGMNDARDEAALIARGQAVARQEGIYLAMPLYSMHPQAERRPENKLLIVAPSGEVVLEHVKYGGSFIEGSKPGDRVLRTVETPYGTLSGVICWDADFPGVVRQAGRNGTDILLVPAGDWRAIDPLHTRMAVFRAVENGVSLVRQVGAGLSMAVDPYGRVLAQTDHFAASEWVMVAQVPTQGVRTLYAVVGDLFGWVSLVGLVVVAGWAIARRRRAAAAGAAVGPVPD